jgi:hypothetical protein
MTLNSPPFGLKLSNIPLLNLRMEFNQHYALIHEHEFDDYFKGAIRPIRSPYFLWLAMPSDFLTLVLQRAILGLESYIAGAVYMDAGERGKLTAEVAKKLNNPFSLGARSAVDNVYDRLPSIVNPEFSLKEMNPHLWESNRLFYSKIRNPLFHGKQITDPNPHAIRLAFNHLALLYEWIDVWYPPEGLIKGGASFSNVRSRQARME